MIGIKEAGIGVMIEDATIEIDVIKKTIDEEIDEMIEEEEVVVGVVEEAEIG